MPIAHYELIQKSKVEQQINQRYYREINETRALGFEDLHFMREVSFPYSVLAFFFVYPYMLYKREIFRIEMPLRYVILNPLLTNSTEGSYCHIFGLGTKFITLFTDGTAVITCNYSEAAYSKPALKIYKYSPSGRSITIAEAWEQHELHVLRMERQGLERDTDLSLEKYERVSELDGQIMMGRDGRKTKKDNQ